MFNKAIISIALTAAIVGNVRAMEAPLIPLDQVTAHADWLSHSFFDKANDALTISANTIASDMTAGAHVFCFLSNGSKDLYMSVSSYVDPNWGSADVALILTVDDNFPEPFMTSTFGNETFILQGNIKPIISQMTYGETLLIRMFGKGENGRQMDIVVSLMGFTKASSAALAQCDFS